MSGRIATVVLAVAIVLALSGIPSWLEKRAKHDALIVRIRQYSIDSPDCVYWVGRHDYGKLSGLSDYHKRPDNSSIRYFRNGAEL